MKFSTHFLGLAVLPLACALAGCETSHHIIIEQPKPLEMNVNISGRLELVVEDARQDMDKITGEKGKAVRPEDIGLPPAAPASPPPARPGATSNMPALPASIAYLTDFGRAPSTALLASEADLKASMAKRNAAVRAILDTHFAGEAHTGLLTPITEGKLTADQKATIDAENADRSALYKQEADRRGISQDDVSLSYYLARLGHAKKGDWYQKYNKDTRDWEWKQWGAN